MKQSARLSSAVFQLTPTRTRCDLIIKANGKEEKIASGLLNPFLAHLKTAQDQIDKGGYSILLEPVKGSDASWFTKATLKRFVRFVSTPEILERVHTIETEILQIGDAIALQNSNDIGQITVENHQRKSLGGNEGGKPVSNANHEKAIILYTPGAILPETNGSCSQEDNSKAQLLKVLETRKTALQNEQGMAFARAVAAGFDIDHVVALVSFAECFGAMRLMEACSRFIDLWNCKHETGQWLDMQASEALSTQPDFSAMKASGIVLSGTCNNQNEVNHDLVSEHIGKSGSNNADSPASNGQQEQFQGQFPHLVFPQWPMHAPPGSPPVFQAYSVQGMPYYHPYASNGPFVQPHHYPPEHSPSNLGSHSGQKRQSLGVRDSNNDSELREAGRTSSLDDTASDADASQSRRSRKKSGGYSKKKGTVVIRNINYIASSGKKSGSATDSESHSDGDTESENVGVDDKDVNRHSRSLKRGGSQLRSVDRLSFDHDEVSILGKDTDDRHWQAFQACLLRGNDEDAQADNEGMFAMEKGVKLKRRANASDDPLALCAQDVSEIQDNRMNDIYRTGGSTSRKLRGSGAEVQFSSVNNDFRGSDDKTDIHLAESNGTKILLRTTHEDYMIGNQRSQANFRNSPDPLALNRYESTINKTDRESSPGMADESLIGSLRSMSLDQDGRTDRTVIDMDSEIPSKYQKSGPEGLKNKVEYEPNDLTLMPERRIDKRSIVYDPALDYEMQVCAEVSEKKGGKDVTNVKGGLKKPDKDKRSKVTSGPMRKAKPSKMNPSDDAKARAERLRAYKADLQKVKQEQEEAQKKRLEALKLERQKRIAARGGANAVKSLTPSPQAKQLPTRPSAATNRGSKFSDSEPGSSSPLQRSKVRTSVGSGVSHKLSKASILSDGSHTAGNRLIRSSSSLSDIKRETNGITPDSKASMSRIRRLSEPKTITTSPAITVKARSAEALLKRKLPEGPERNKVSAIISLDRSKAATLPELKIKTVKLRVNADEKISTVKDSQVNGVKPCVDPEKAEINAKISCQTHELDLDENPIVDKTVVVLESEKPSAPTLKSPEGKHEVWSQKPNKHDVGEKSNAIHAPLSSMDGVDREAKTYQLQQQSDYNKVKSSCADRDPPNIASNNASEQPYRAPHARVSSLEDPSTRRTEYGKSPLASSGMPLRAEETLKAHVPDVKALKMDKNQASSEKTVVKESSRGLRRLLMFGKKNQSSSVDRSVDSECTSGDGNEHDDSSRKTTSTGEVHTLKNLISQDETSTNGNAPQKTSRHFSLLSPFRIKSSEKKQAS